LCLRASIDTLVPCFGRVRLPASRARVAFRVGRCSWFGRATLLIAWSCPDRQTLPTIPAKPICRFAGADNQNTIRFSFRVFLGQMMGRRKRVRVPLFALFSFLFMFGYMATSCCKAQSLSQLRSEFGNGPLPYAPQDPATRSGLLNLQTGHAGAFYNCDGEESKRFSPHITWKSAQGDRLYRPCRDILNWCKDRAEIAQRICDGAGPCCSGGCESCHRCEQCRSRGARFANDAGRCCGLLAVNELPSQSLNQQAIAKVPAKEPEPLVSSLPLETLPEEKEVAPRPKAQTASLLERANSTRSYR